MKKNNEDRTKLSLTIDNIKEAINLWEQAEKTAVRVQEAKADEEKRKSELIKSLKEQLDSLT